MKTLFVVLFIVAAIIAIIVLIAGIVGCIVIEKMLKIHSERMKEISDNMIQIKKKD